MHILEQEFLCPQTLPTYMQTMTLESNTDSDKEVAELWELAGQLSNALAKNRENMESLVNDIEELKVMKIFVIEVE